MLNYVVIQLGYMTQVSICAKYVAIQLHQETKQTNKKKKHQASRISATLTTGAQTPATSPNSLSQLF